MEKEYTTPNYPKKITAKKIGEKEFNLSEEREKWISKWLRKPVTARALAELKQTDTEFIKRLKEAGNENDWDIMLEYGEDENITISFNEWIDKLAGEKLIEDK